MSKIEKALEKFKKEPKGEAGQTSTPKKYKHTGFPGLNTSDKETTRHESHITSAIEKSKNENKTILDCKSELNVRDRATLRENAVSPAQGTSREGQYNGEPLPTTTIDTYNVNERIVSYYCAIDKPTWKGPVMVHFRRLQFALANMQKSSDCKVVLFTSSAQGEGKSTISANVAITLCGDQKSRVALVDCDFRRPSISRLLGFTAEKGLADYLTEGAGIENIAFDGLVPGLTIIPAGSKQTNVYELLDSNRMKEFVPYLKERFDYVIIDTPPVLTFSDTAILAPLADGVAFVINCKKTKKTIVKRAIEVLKDHRIIGFVANQGDTVADDYYGYK
jgi:protein-tyrosine kinase